MEPKFHPMRPPFPVDLGAIVANKSAFSLVELLVVVAVIGMVTALSVGGLSARNAASLRNAGAVAGGVADAARQMALSSRVRTALAVAITGPDAYRALAVLKCDPGGQWVPATKWTRLPENIIFDSTDSDFFTAAASSVTNAIQISGTTLSAGTGFKAQGVCKDGTLEGQAIPMKLRLREGFYTNGAHTFTAGTTNRFFDIVLIPTGGRVKYVQP
jgi:prepilin-type N-terminal cleavage/methylation domain-containing protein